MPANGATMESEKPLPVYQQESYVDYDNLTNHDEVSDANEAGTSDGVYTHYDKVMSVVQELTNTNHRSEEAQLSVYEDCQSTSPVGVCVIRSQLLYHNVISGVL